jgi:stage III sporulation protein AG
LKRFFEKLFSSESGSEKLAMKPKYFIILGLVGILLLLVSNLFQSNEAEEPQLEEQPIVLEQETDAEKMNTTETTEIEQITRSYEQDIVSMLNKIQGVEEAEVMINLESSDVKVYERNLITGTQTTSEEDQSGGVREVEDQTEDSQVVLVRQGDTEKPILVQTKRPDVRGVFVVAKGAEQASVRGWIIEAISRVLDVPSHRISVMPKD